MKKNIARQGGAALIIALMFLLLITLVATTGAQTSTLQLQMAGNEQSRVEAQQHALAILDAIIDDTDNAPVVGGIGFKICEVDSADGSCDLLQISLDEGVTTLPAAMTQWSPMVTPGRMIAPAPRKQLEPMWVETCSRLTKSWVKMCTPGVMMV